MSVIHNYCMENPNSKTVKSLKNLYRETIKRFKKVILIVRAGQHYEFLVKPHVNFLSFKAHFKVGFICLWYCVDFWLNHNFGSNNPLNCQNVKQ